MYCRPLLPKHGNVCLSSGGHLASCCDLPDKHPPIPVHHHRTPHRMVSAWAQQVQVRLSSFEPSAAAALILSFHQLGCSDEALYSSLAGVVASRADACPTSELVGAAWALAASHASDTATPLLERLAERLEAPGTLDGCGPRTCAVSQRPWLLITPHSSCCCG